MLEEHEDGEELIPSEGAKVKEGINKQVAFAAAAGEEHGLNQGVKGIQATETE